CVQSVNFFFYQAEDGIRDFHVTGVQTCALPISEKKSSMRHLSDNQSARRPLRVRRTYLFSTTTPDSPALVHVTLLPILPVRNIRSDERRVGKECIVRSVPHYVIENIHTVYLVHV